MDERMRWWERLNRALFPYFGPAELGAGPDGERPESTTRKLCPLCGEPMDEHRIERTADWSTPTRLHCPV